ncbi:hypothetical protein OBBRIDRAFT_720572 [Obba rivulosa]|uniref:Golgi apparatus membrane protein TVP38 n=1 Tax=Obba rivulosa TaxID=1052685 RepID=A0A8E2J679_9APHY|nr:hypothetical protein OBBRIDRAFT_720572 [Obba rivulosa]
MDAPYPSYGARQVQLPEKALSFKTVHAPAPRYPGMKHADLKRTDVGVDFRELARTPDPTPEEYAALHPEKFNIKKLFTKKFWFNKKMLVKLLLIGLLILFALTFTIYRQQIANALSPVTTWIHGLKFGWLIPIAIMIVLSFPPLFGHEIVTILVGLVWGVGAGFWIVAAGTIIGELISFQVFRHCCIARNNKMEKTNIKYACLAKVVRQGGFKVVLIMRYSAIPSHFSTAVFSTCGISLKTFLLAIVLSLPKQLNNVFLGATLVTPSDDLSRFDNVLEKVTIVVTLAATVVGFVYINKRTKTVLPEVIYERRKARYV